MKSTWTRMGSWKQGLRRMQPPVAVVAAQSGHEYAAGRFHPLQSRLGSDTCSRQPWTQATPGLRPGWTRFRNGEQRELRSQGAGPTGSRGKGCPAGKREQGQAWVAVPFFQLLAMKGERRKSLVTRRAGWGTGEGTEPLLELAFLKGRSL